MHRIHHYNGVVSYTFESLDGLPVCAHVSTRHGGVSPAPWTSLNFSITRGDTPARVQENFARFCAALGVDPAHRVHTHQVHGTGVAKVDWDDAGTRRQATDALITDAVELPLLLFFADCVPVLLYDPVVHALGVCHAGWRGTVNGMAATTLWAMQAAYGTNPADLRVCIGPSIGPQSYEVGEEVYNMAQAKLPGADRFFHFPNGSESHPHFDLWQANAAQLIEAGVPAAQIEISGIDTAQTTQDFYSHRAEQGQCGLFGILAWLEKMTR
jgi:YfiH family protein